MKRIADSKLLVLVASLAALVLWGGTPVANKLALGTMDAFAVGVLRSVSAGLIALVTAIVFGFQFPGGTKARLLLFISGISSFALWPVLMSVGLRFTTANHAGLIIAVIPIITGVFAAAVERQWPDKMWWLGGILALTGATLLVILRSDEAQGSASKATMAGDMIVIAGAVCCAVGYVAGGKLTPLIGTWATTFWGLTIASLMLTPAAAFIVARNDWSSVSASSWFALGYLAIVGSLVGYLLWFWALGRGGIGRIATWQLMQPVITVLLAGLFLGESLTIQFLLAAIVIIGGTVIAQSRRARSPIRQAKDQ